MRDLQLGTYVCNEQSGTIDRSCRLSRNRAPERPHAAATLLPEIAGPRGPRTANGTINLGYVAYSIALEGKARQVSCVRLHSIALTYP